jgi:hypothetical protein
MLEAALIVALHGAHAGGVDGGWIGSLAVVALILVTLALASRRARK